jgi:hypothetical protein
MNASKRRLLTLQETEQPLSIDERFRNGEKNGLGTNSNKYITDLQGACLYTTPLQALEHGCVRRFETKTAGCIMGIIYDLNKKHHNMLTCWNL